MVLIWIEQMALNNLQHIKLLTKMISKKKRLKLPMKIFLMTTVVFLKASPLECSLIQKIWKNNCIESTFLEENELVTAKLFRWLNADILSQLMKSEFWVNYTDRNWKGDQRPLQSTALLQNEDLQCWMIPRKITSMLI